MYFERSKSECLRCPLSDENRVWGVGPAERVYPIAIFGEAPGKVESETGLPFQGKSGELLRATLSEVGFVPEHFWISNGISCRPPDNKLSSKDGKIAISRCRPGLDEELDFLAKKGYAVAVTLGKNASSFFGVMEPMQECVNEPRLHNNWIVTPMYHPSFIVRSGGKSSPFYSGWKEGFTALRKLLDVENLLEEMHGGNEFYSQYVECPTSLRET